MLVVVVVVVDIYTCVTTNIALPPLQATTRLYQKTPVTKPPSCCEIYLYRLDMFTNYRFKIL